jgi:hypothetical protein
MPMKLRRRSAIFVRPELHRKQGVLCVKHVLLVLRVLLAPFALLENFVWAAIRKLLSVIPVQLVFTKRARSRHRALRVCQE